MVDKSEEKEGGGAFPMFFVAFCPFVLTVSTT